MTIEELEQDYLDDCRSYDSAVTELISASEWLTKMYQNKLKSFRALEDEKMRIEAQRLTQHND